MTEGTPADVIRSYGALREAVTPLALLGQTSPRLLEDVITLAMVMGIHAAEHRAVVDAKLNALSQDLDHEKFNFWRGQR